MGVIPKLSLGIKLEKGGVQSTGPHLVTFVGAEHVVGKDWKSGKERREMRIDLMENGRKCFYQFPIRDDRGQPHYLIAKLMEVKAGDQRVLELKSKGAMKFIEVRVPGEVGRV